MDMMRICACLNCAFDRNKGWVNIHNVAMCLFIHDIYHTSHNEFRLFRPCKVSLMVGMRAGDSSAWHGVMHTYVITG